MGPRQQQRSEGLDLGNDWQVVGGEPRRASSMGHDAFQCLRRMDPDAIERHQWPEPGKRRRSWGMSQPLVEHVHDRTPRQPVVEVTEYHHQRVPYRIEVLEYLSHLKS